MHDKGNPIMIIHTHVDDLLVAFDTKSKKAKETMGKLVKELHLQGGVRNKFEYLSRIVEISEKHIKISLPKSARSIELIPVSAERKKNLDSPVTEEERHEMRSILGILQWLSGQTRPDIAVATNKCAQRITKAVVKDLIDCNTIGKQVLETPDLGLTINRGVFDMHNYMVLCFGDAAFANAETVKSQCGEIAMVCRKEHLDSIIDGRYDLAVLLSWRSATIKRVVRSTLAAEGYAISEAAELAEWLKQVLEEMQIPGRIDPRIVEEKAEKRLSVVCTDSDSLESTVGKDAGSVADRRFRIVVAMLRQTFSSPSRMLKWVNTKQMLGDGLTKALCPPLAILALMSGARYAVPTGRTRGLLRTALVVAHMKHSCAYSQVTPYEDSDEDFITPLILNFLFALVFLVVTFFFIRGVYVSIMKGRPVPVKTIILKHEGAQTEHIDLAPPGLEHVPQAQNLPPDSTCVKPSGFCIGNGSPARSLGQGNGAILGTVVYHKSQLPGTVMCLHNSLTRTGRGANFLLSCSSCGMIICAGETGCSHDRITMSGTNQFGPRMLCVDCNTLLLRNVSGSARYIPEKQARGMTCFKRNHDQGLTRENPTSRRAANH